MKKHLTLLVLFITFISSPSYAEGKWQFVMDLEYCYIQSSPIKTEIPDGKSRGDYGMLVYKMHKSTDMIIQITAGFDYKSSDSVSVKVDESEYNFYTDEDTAWAKDDKKVIYAMKKGLKLTTTGLSSKGTKVTDTYTLKGFTTAINQLSNDC
jgi:hypothetical protein